MAISPSTSVSRTAQTSVAVPVEEAAVVNAPSTLDDPSSKVDSFHGPTGTVETGGVTFRVADGQVSTLDKDGTEVACGTCDDKGHYQVTLDGHSFSGDVGKLLDVRYVGTLSHGSKVDNLAAGARTELTPTRPPLQGERAGNEPVLYKLGDGSMRLWGTNANDQIAVDRLNNGDVKISVSYANGAKAKDITLKPEEFTTLRIMAGAGDDGVTLSKGLDDQVTVLGGDGNDTISSRSKAAIFGQAGNDIMSNRGKGGFVDGGEGHDTITNFGNGARLSGGEGNDLIRNTASGSRDARIGIEGGGGDDTILSQGEWVQINAGGGDDQVLAAGYGLDVTGSDGVDQLAVSGQESRLAWGSTPGETAELTAEGKTLSDLLKRFGIRKPIVG